MRPAIALTLVITCQLMITVTIIAVNISLPAIRTELRLSVSGLSWAENAYLLAFGGLLLLGARTGDILGRRRTFVAGVIVFTAASVAGALATSLVWLITALAAQGVGSALAEPAAIALIAANVPVGPRRNRALGIFSTTTGLGLTLGLVVGGTLSTVSWRLALLAAIPFGAAILALVPMAVRETERVKGRFDLAGALTCTVGTTALVYGLVRASGEGWTDVWTAGTLLGAVLLLTATVVIESRAAQPIIPLRLLTNRHRGGAYAALLLVGTLGGTLLFCLFQFMQDVLGLSPVGTGVAFLPFALTLLVAALLTPRLPTRPVLVCGILLVIAGALWLTRLSPSSGYAEALLGPLLFLGAGYGFAIAALNLALLSRVPKDAGGAVAGLQQTMVRLGASLGLAGTVTVFTLVAGAGETAELAVRGYAGAFGLTVAFFALALVVALVTLRPSGIADDENG
ncbi:MFS transporter [Streptosporangium saharense]|uniref:MFS transporter n=1 Tax=Streptosporangium saharense TaxID=1706840 RepID=UPI0036A8B8B9